MKLVYAILLMLVVSAPAAAQVNKCDATVPTNPSLQSPVKPEFCWDGKDKQGNVVDPSTVQVRVKHNATTHTLVALPAPVGTPTADGRKWYSLPPITLAKGNYTQTVTLVTPDGEGDLPAPFAFAVVGVPPSTVTKQQATQ